MNEFNDLAEQLRKNQRPITEAEESAYFFKNDICPKLKAGGLPDRFWNEIASWNRSQKFVFDKCIELLVNRGAIVALVGDRGTGKTTIVAQIMIARVKSWLAYYGSQPEDRKEIPRGNGRYFKLSEIVRDFKPLYSDFGSINTEELIRRQNLICETALLTIDETHECGDQRMGDKIMTDMIDRRYATLRDTILVSNQTPQEFQATTSDSILSRLSEHGAIIACSWPSYRNKLTINTDK